MAERLTAEPTEPHFADEGWGHVDPVRPDDGKRVSVPLWCRGREGRDYGATRRRPADRRRPAHVDHLALVEHAESDRREPSGCRSTEAGRHARGCASAADPRPPLTVGMACDESVASGCIEVE